jgi:transcriptional regulator with XRE-family HTH domain
MLEMPMSQQPEPFGAVLHRIRTGAGFNSRQMADRAGVSVEVYDKWEEGIGVPSAQQFKRLQSFIPRLREGENLAREGRTRMGLAAADKTLLDPSRPAAAPKRQTPPLEKPVPTPAPPDNLYYANMPAPASLSELATKQASAMLAERRAKARIAQLEKEFAEARAKFEKDIVDARAEYDLLVDENVRLQEEVIKEADRLSEASL